ncbi:MAG: hypothetical protein HC872_03000 [Gammaproteobacteria bacterium]|nr:hypothetical protein [Gammaproteobacteria bacterium]
MPRHLVSSLVLLFGVGWAALTANASTERQWRFTVLLDGKPIGHHHVDLTGTEEVEYRSETKLNVKVLFLTVFRYLHVDRETWRDDCLTRIDSTTDDDGKAQFVRGTRGNASFMLTTERGAREHTAPCVMTFAYWNPKVLSATRLMNAQTGEYLPVRIETLGTDRIQVRGQQLEAEHFAIVGDKLEDRAVVRGQQCRCG